MARALGRRELAQLDEIQAEGPGILITMLADGPVTEQVWNGPDGLTAADPGLIWVEMASVGIERPASPAPDRTRAA